MKTIRYSNKYKKDFKKYQYQTKKLDKLIKVITALINEEVLPAELNTHKLTGKYGGCLECHIEGDFLLIWFDEKNDTIVLFRLGSHSELFR